MANILPLTSSEIYLVSQKFEHSFYLRKLLKLDIIFRILLFTRLKMIELLLVAVWDNIKHFRKGETKLVLEGREVPSCDGVWLSVE